MTVWRYQLLGNSRRTGWALVGLAVMAALLAFITLALIAPAPAHASGCRQAGCGMPAWDSPHGAIGTAEMAYRAEPYVITGNAAVLGAARSFVQKDEGFFVAAAGRQTRVLRF